MQESVDSVDDNTEPGKDAPNNSSSRVRTPSSPVRACKIPKNTYCDLEPENIALDDSTSYSGASSSHKNSLTKEDSGFAEKINVSSSETYEDLMDGVDSIEPEKSSETEIATDNASITNNSDGSSEPLFTSSNRQVKQRNYRKRSFANLDDSSNDCDNRASTSSADGAGVDVPNTNRNVVTETESSIDEESSLDCYLDSDDSSDSDNDLDTLCDSDDNTEEDESKTPLVLLKPKPKHNWSALSEILTRPYGLSPTAINSNHMKRSWGSRQFQQRYYRSLHAVQRLELMYKLQAHDGCVNSLCFNKSGNLLASGSDDLYINLWSWSVGKKVMSFKSGHRSNVFQSKFLPCEGELHIASSARDGQVRLSILSPSGDLVSSRKLCQHRGMVNKISLVTDQPHIILSAGDDGLVISTDIRDPVPNKVTKVLQDARKVPLYSIYCHPLLGHEFVVGGKDQFVRIYDLRNSSKPQAKFKPLSGTQRLDNKACRSHDVHITSVIYNYNGREILASYTNDDIYLFANDPSVTLSKSSSLKNDERDYIGRYTGHRNQATIKSANFFGPQSEYILSGSDCSYCYIWDKKTESIVQWFRGDENGVVNCMEPHPHIPVIATSGLDYDVKIWVPSKEEPNSLDELKNVVRVNKRRSVYMGQYQEGLTDWIDGQMLWMFLTHVHRNEENARDGINNTDDTTQSDSSDDDFPGQGGSMPCAPS